MEQVLELIRQLRERLRLTMPQTLTLFLVVMFFASLLCMVLFVEVADEMLDAEQLVAFDQQLALALYGGTTEGWTRAFSLLTLFGSQVVLVLALVVGLWLALRRRWLDLAIWLVALGGGQLLNTVLKLLFARERPVFAEPLAVERFYSFPSGHAMLSMIAYGMLAYFVLSRVRRRWLKAVVVVLALAFIGLIGFSRLYLGVHYFSDVLAGFFAGGAWLFACITTREAIRRRRSLREQKA